MSANRTTENRTSQGPGVCSKKQKVIADFDTFFLFRQELNA